MAWVVRDKVDARVQESEWRKLGLNEKLVKGLLSCNFSSPTEVQRRVLPLALQGRDVIGAAETGSGKTLAFGLPILNEIAFSVQEYGQEAVLGHLFGLILAPTRELAIQIKDHLDAVSKFLEFQSNSKGVVVDGGSRQRVSYPPRIAAVVGGMSIEKQKRLLGLSQNAQEAPQIIVATPGRLWDIIEGSPSFLEENLKRISFLVVDEADKMLVKGSFQELTKVLRALSGEFVREKDWEVAVDMNEVIKEVDYLPDTDLHEQVLRLEKEAGVKDSDVESVENVGEGLVQGNDLADDGDTRDTLQVQRQSMVFSATLINSKRVQKLLASKRSKRSNGMMMSYDMLLETVGFQRDQRPKVVSILPKRLVSSKVIEKRIHCLHKEKYTYVCYLLACYSETLSIIFVNTVPEARKLRAFIELIKPTLQVHVLHAQMAQKQRLNTIEAFRGLSAGILVATDVAARGLDIPAVELVIHFDVPHNPAVYVHRSGRSARKNFADSGQNLGVSILLVTSGEFAAYQRICKSLSDLAGRESSGGEPIPPLTTDGTIFEQLLPIAQLALQIVEKEQELEGCNKKERFLLQAAKALDVDIPSDMEDLDEELTPSKKRRAKAAVDGRDLYSLKLKLTSLLKKTVLEKNLRQFKREHRISEANVGHLTRVFNATPGVVSTYNCSIQSDSLVNR